MKLIKEGAEAKIFLDEDKIIKKRISKSYRIKELDEKLRKFRTKREFKILKFLYDNNVKIPKPIDIDLKDMKIIMEYIKGVPLKDVISKELLFKFFKEIIKIHSLNVTHNDLTTLNAIIKNNDIYIIDFGLAKFNSKIEDKGEDLNLFFNNIKNEHFELYKYKEELESLYKKKWRMEK